MNMRISLILLILLISSPAGAFDALGLMKASLATEPDQPPVTVPVSGACTHGAMMPANVCEVGSGFLCVDTPPLSTTDEDLTIKGTIDVKNNVLTTFTVSIQNEYTNEYNQYKFAPADIAIDENGFYSATVPLGNKYGPYSISVAATRSNGAPAEKKLRVSRVTAPKLLREDIKLEVDESGTAARITIDLLKSCPACDFFGVTTGGLTASAVNIITGADGGTKQISESTNVASGGLLSLCLTLGNGTNAISVSICNAATGYNESACPTVVVDPFNAKGTPLGIEWTQPIKPAYSADTNPEVSLAFRLANVTAGTSCEDANVRLDFNRDPEAKICADKDGLFKLNLKPQTGVNIGNIYSGNNVYPFSFAWGEIVSPFEANGKVKSAEDLWIKNAGAFSINQDVLKYTVRGMINNFLKSEEVKKMIQGIMKKNPETAVPAKNTKSKEEINNIRGLIPGCKSKSGDSGYNFELYADPVIDGVEIPGLEFGEDIIKIQLNIKQLMIKAKVALDEGLDGVLEGTPMPFIIALGDLSAPVQIRVDRDNVKPLFIITSEYTDCKYKPGYSCKHKPVVIVPQEFDGAATKGGGLVKCDVGVNDGCVKLNSDNARTGELNTVVLDSINDMLYCDGSANLTYLFREFLREVPIQVGCNTIPGYTKAPLLKLGECKDSGIMAGKGWVLPVGLDLLNNQFNVNENGISGIVPATVGSPEFYANMPKALQTPSIGFIRKPLISSTSEIVKNSAGKDFGAAIHEDFINALLFALSQQGENGILDWDIHEQLLKKIGFDPVKECDEFQAGPDNDKLPSLCFFLPRVGDMLGNTITANGYFPQKYPIVVKVRGSHEVSPRIGFFSKDGKQYLDVQLGDVQLAFYALQVDPNVPADKNGVPTLKLDANGDPIILSMNPNDKDPENGQIIKVLLSATIAAEISNFVTDETKPSNLKLTIRPEPTLSKIVFKPIPGGNATIVPDRNLISAMEEMIKYGLNIYSEPDKALKIGLPKDIVLGGGTSSGGDLFKSLGLEKISFGADGLGLKIEDSQEFLDLMLKIKN